MTSFFILFAYVIFILCLLGHSFFGLLKLQKERRELLSEIEQSTTFFAEQNNTLEELIHAMEQAEKESAYSSLKVNWRRDGF
jgi:hypothetical protein